MTDCDVPSFMHGRRQRLKWMIISWWELLALSLFVLNIVDNKLPAPDLSANAKLTGYGRTFVVSTAGCDVFYSYVDHHFIGCIMIAFNCVAESKCIPFLVWNAAYYVLCLASTLRYYRSDNSAKKIYITKVTIIVAVCWVSEWMSQILKTILHVKYLITLVHSSHACYYLLINDCILSI